MTPEDARPKRRRPDEPAGEPATEPVRRQELEVQVRFGDTDALGHVNNAAFATYAELGRLDLMRNVSWDQGGPILARIAIDFHHQLLLGTRVVVASEVPRIGRSSIELHQEILSDGVKVATVASVVVWFDYDKQRPVRVPDHVRSVLQGGA